MSKIKNGGLDQYHALNLSNRSNLEQLASKGLIRDTSGMRYRVVEACPRLVLYLKVNRTKLVNSDDSSESSTAAATTTTSDASSKHHSLSSQQVRVETSQYDHA